jgi:S-methylmethionine-dependent homocysteine/selenocysteine methylase
MTVLADRLAGGDVVLIDGAMGTELQRRGVAMDGVDWCATALATDADAVRAIHADYMTAGAEINIANTFAAGRHVLEPAGLGDQAVALNRRAVELVQEARDQAAMGSVWVAGSISDFIAGNDPANRPSLATLSASFREQAETFAEAGADLIIVEMIRAADTGVAMVEAAVATGRPVWAGFSFRRDADGAPVMLTKTHVIDPLDVVPAVMAAGASLPAVMHSDIDVTGPGLDLVARLWDGPLAVYPNSGYFVMPEWQFEDIIDPPGFVAAVEDWIAGGTRVVGGCCGIGVEHVRALANAVAGRA